MIPLSGIGIPSQNDGKVLIFYQNFGHLVCYNYRIAMSIFTRRPIVVFFAVGGCEQAKLLLVGSEKLYTTRTQSLNEI